MYFYTVDYSERGPSGHQLNLHQSLRSMKSQGLLHSNQNSTRAFNEEASNIKSV